MKSKIQLSVLQWPNRELESVEAPQTHRGRDYNKYKHSVLCDVALDLSTSLLIHSVIAKDQLFIQALQWSCSAKLMHYCADLLLCGEVVCSCVNCDFSKWPTYV